MTCTTICSPEHLITIPEAAKALGVPVSTLRRAAKANLFRTYQIMNARKRVLLSEVRAAIGYLEQGGRNNG